MEIKKDRIGKRTPSLAYIAHKHGTSLLSLRDQVKKGVKIEKEHTHSSAEAREIALDHLAEFPDYYSRLLRMEKKAKREMREGWVDPIEAIHNATRARILQGAKEGKYWLLRSEGLEENGAEYAYAWKNLRPKLQNAAVRAGHFGAVAGLPAITGYIAARKNKNNLKTAAAAIGATTGASQVFRQSQTSKWKRNLKDWENTYASNPEVSTTYTDPRTKKQYSGIDPLIRGARVRQGTRGVGFDTAVGAGGYALGSFLGHRAARRSRMTESERDQLINGIIETVTTASIGGYNKPLGVDSRDITMGRRNRWTRDELSAAIGHLLNRRSSRMPTP